MQIPEFTLIATPADAEGALLLPVLAGESPTLIAAGDYGLTDERLRRLEATGKSGRATRILVSTTGSGDDERVALLLGLGAERDAESLRRAGGVAARALGGEAAAVLDLAGADAAELEAFATGFALGAHKLDRYTTKPADGDADEPQTPDERRLALVAEGEDARAAIERARIIAAAVALARDLANTPSNDLVPDDFAGLAVERAGAAGIEVEVWDEARLAEEGCGGLVGVGQGSANPPRLVRLGYAPAGADEAPHVALVGKGITFDTGGISLKPPASMVGMKFDMCGAASVLAAMLGIAELELPVRVSGWLCLAENMPSAHSIKPDDVLRMRGGTTVEVTNTDAEGRLVMADGLVLATEDESVAGRRPDAIVDIATLTGAAMAALGERTIGVMGNDEIWRERVLAASARTGEAMWSMPIPEELDDRLDSNVADLVNAKPGDRAGGMLFAAAFLERFIGEREGGESIPWVHLDIAGPADNGGGPHGYTPKGATGVPVRTLIETVAALVR